MVGMQLSRLRPLLLSFALGCVCLVSLSASAQIYVGKPKLIVIVVIDQFRADQLNRHQAEFKGLGFNLFMKQGAWFTDCYYDYANTKTGPGHATIGTGAYSDGHGIDSNEWSYDRHVPLPFYGAPFKPGEYHDLVAPVDMAVTFASLAGVNRPSAAVGKVLIEAIKPTTQPAAGR